MTAFSVLTAAIAAKLAEAPAIADSIDRGRPWPIPTGVDSAAWVYPATSVSERTGVEDGPIDWRTTFVIEVRVRFSPDSEAADEAVDDLLGEIFARLSALSIAGVQDVVPGTSIEWSDAESDVNVAAFVLRLDVVHRTLSSQLTAFA